MLSGELAHGRIIYNVILQPKRMCLRGKRQNRIDRNSTHRLQKSSFYRIWTSISSFALWWETSEVDSCQRVRLLPKSHFDFWSHGITFFARFGWFWVGEQPSQSPPIYDFCPDFFSPGGASSPCFRFVALVRIWAGEHVLSNAIILERKPMISCPDLVLTAKNAVRRAGTWAYNL